MKNIRRCTNYTTSRYVTLHYCETPILSYNEQKCHSLDVCRHHIETSIICIFKRPAQFCQDFHLLSKALLQELNIHQHDQQNCPLTDTNYTPFVNVTWKTKRARTINLQTLMSRTIQYTRMFLMPIKYCIFQVNASTLANQMIPATSMRCIRYSDEICPHQVF